MTSKEFTAYGRRPSISDTCIFIHFNQRLLKTQGNISVPLKITFFFIMFPLLFGGLGFSRGKKKSGTITVCFDFTLFLLLFLSKLHLRELKTKAALIKCQLCARNYVSPYLYMKPCILSKIVITLPIPLMKKLRDAQIFAQGQTANKWQTGWCLNSHLSTYKIHLLSMTSHCPQFWRIKLNLL